MWLFGDFGAGKLAGGQRLFVQAFLVAFGLALGGVAGSVIGRNRHVDHPVYFGMTTGALCGAACGAIYALTMGVAFVGNFGGFPVDFSDGLFVVLSFPVFAALGMLTGTMPGSLLGALGGYLAMRSHPVATRRDPVLE